MFVNKKTEVFLYLLVKFRISVINFILFFLELFFTVLLSYGLLTIQSIVCKFSKGNKLKVLSYLVKNVSSIIIE